MKRHGYNEQELRAMPQAKLELIVQALTGHKAQPEGAATRRIVSQRRKTRLPKS